MQRSPPRALPDLLAATEAIGDDKPVRRCIADRRQKLQFSDSQRYIIFFFLKPEGASHSATAGRRRLKIDPKTPQYTLLIFHLHNGFVMAVAMKQCSAPD